MGAMTNYLELKVLDHTLRLAAYSVPSGIYMSLHTADPTETGAVGEVSGGSYVRKAVTFGTAAASGAISNTTEVLFPVATGDWGTISHFALWDAESNGNALYYGAFSTAKGILTGDQFKVNIGGVTVSLD